MDKQMQLLWAKMKEEMEKQQEKQTQIIKETISKTIEEQLSHIRKENEVLKEEVATLRSKVKILDIEARKTNLILHGVEENETNNTELMKQVLELLNDLNKSQNATHEWDKWEISKLHRIGKKVQNKNRPIKIVFTLVWRRNEILTNKKHLPKGIYITEDLTKEEMDLRKSLYAKLKEARVSGKYAYIKHGKLIIKDQQESEKRKRASSSPPSTPPNSFSKVQEEDIVKQPTKFSKINPNQTVKNIANSKNYKTIVAEKIQ
ncbi:unnamed protein product [Chilo suppressalis]|uniref:Endonuclease-reverse transcriptase n=1 Tax=Chilo suppressalis TaxID=168631 RepID=A0ABN8BFH7_CHISP|nr:unnamed protein product [Chilo suppressalis]